MPRQPIRARTDDSNYNLVIRIPGWFKNEILEHVDSLGTQVNIWVTSALREALRAQQGLPPAPPAAAPLPTLDEVLRSYVTGEKLLMPCGKPGPCAGEDPVELGSFWYCRECSIRVQ